MKKRIMFIFCLFLVEFFASGLSFAEAPQADSLSLEKALVLAYWKNPKIVEAREEIRAARGRWIQSEGLPDPEFELKVGGLKRGTDGSRKGNVDSFAIKQPLDPLGTRFLKGRIGWDDVRIAKEGVSLVWGEVRKTVSGLYGSILAEEKAEVIARDNLDATRQFFTRVETSFQSGNALQSDVLRARIEISRAENDLLIAQKDLKVSKGELNLAIGRSVESPLALSDSFSPEVLRYEYEKIKEQALGKRADIQIETRRLSARKKSSWQALLKVIFPKMSLGLERTTTDYENDTAVILEASYPLWGFNLGEVKEAKAEKVKQEVRLEALKRQVGLEVFQAFLEAELSDRQVALQQKALEEANELLRQITLRYEEGEVPFLTYLENIKTIKETRLAYFNALKNYKEKVAELETAIQVTPVPEGMKS